MSIKWDEFENESCEYVKLQLNGSEIRMSCGPLMDCHWYEAMVLLTEPFTRTVRCSVEGFTETAAEARARCEASYPILQQMAEANTDAMRQLYAIAGGVRCESTT